MFYQDTIEQQLRFGDVLKGFVIPDLYQSFRTLVQTKQERRC